MSVDVSLYLPLLHISTVFEDLTQSVVFTDPCTENEVRLNDDLVQVCHNGQWGFVCEHPNSYYLPAAKVVCRQVNIPSTS